MKKIKLLTFLIMLITLFSFGCSSVDTANQEIPSFEELLSINTYENILDKYTNFYTKNSWHEVESDANYTEEIVFTKGESKINYHSKRKNITTNEEIFSASRIDDNWYYNPSYEYPISVLELGELSLIDNFISSLPQLISGNVVGRGYLENDFIVYHASLITEATEDYPAKRNDYIYYFNKKTKFIEKVDEIEYNSQNKVAYTYAVEFVYNVKVEDVFTTTLYDDIHNSEKRIDLEIILNYGTEEQQSHLFVTTTDMQVFVSVDFSMYTLYSDCEYLNSLMTLEEYVGQKNLTLYAKPSQESN